MSINTNIKRVDGILGGGIDFSLPIDDNLIIDVNNENAFLVRKDNDNKKIFNIDSINERMTYKDGNELNNLVLGCDANGVSNWVNLNTVLPSMASPFRYNATTHEFEAIPGHADRNPPQTITTNFNAFGSLTVNFDVSNLLTGGNATSIVCLDETYARTGLSIGITNNGPQDFTAILYDNFGIENIIECTDATVGAEVFSATTASFNHIQSVSWSNFNGGRLIINHDRVIDDSGVIMVTDMGGFGVSPYTFKADNGAAGQSIIYFYDASGTQISAASTDMKIGFQRKGSAVFSETSWETKPHTLSNIWLYVEFDRVL